MGATKEVENDEDAESQPPPPATSTDQQTDEASSNTYILTQSHESPVKHTYTASYRYQVVGTLRDEKAKCPDWVQEVVQVRRKESDSHLSLSLVASFHSPKEVEV